MGQFYTLKSDNDWSTTLSNSYKHEMQVYGVLVDFFPMAGVNDWGLYISGGLTSASVKSTVNDSFFGQNNSTNSKVGGQLTVGYQFLIPLKSMANIVFHAGAGYGNAGAIEWRVFSGSKTEIKDSLLLDLQAGMQF